jgi:hypothetical protein
MMAVGVNGAAIRYASDELKGDKRVALAALKVCKRTTKERERERERDRETERERDRETERQRDRETERQRDRETERQRDREREYAHGCVDLRGRGGGRFGGSSGMPCSVNEPGFFLSK